MMKTLYNQLSKISQESFEDIQEHFKNISSRKEEFCIQFLGTGQGAHNIASRGKQQIKGSRFVSGPIISSDKSSIWIDPGPDSLEVVKYIDFDPRLIDSIFVTHAHPDHFGNLICTIELITGATEIKNKKSLYANITTIEGGKDSPSYIDEYHAKYILQNCKTLKVGDIVKNQNIHVEALPCHHKETKYSNNSLNYKINLELGEKNITISHVDGNIFIPDSKGEPSEKIYTDIIDSCEGTDILIANVSNHVKTKTSNQNYLSTDGLLYLIKQIKPKFIFTTHFGIEMLHLNKEGNILLKNNGYTNLVDFQEKYIQHNLNLDNLNCKIIAAQDFMKVGIEKDNIKINYINNKEKIFLL